MNEKSKKFLLKVASILAIAILLVPVVVTLNGGIVYAYAPEDKDIDNWLDVTLENVTITPVTTEAVQSFRQLQQQVNLQSIHLRDDVELRKNGLFIRHLKVAVVASAETRYMELTPKYTIWRIMQTTEPSNITQGSTVEYDSLISSESFVTSNYNGTLGVAWLNNTPIANYQQWFNSESENELGTEPEKVKVIASGFEDTEDAVLTQVLINLGLNSDPDQYVIDYNATAATLNTTLSEQATQEIADRFLSALEEETGSDISPGYYIKQGTAPLVPMFTFNPTAALKSLQKTIHIGRISVGAKLKSFAKDFGSTLTGFGGVMKKTVQSAAGYTKKLVAGAVGGAYNSLKSFFGGIGKSVANIGSMIIDSGKKLISGPLAFFGGFFKQIFRWLPIVLIVVAILVVLYFTWPMIAKKVAMKRVFGR